MSYKNALAGLAAGGGKAVLSSMGTDRSAALEQFGRAVDALGGQYVTAEDAGSSVVDMAVISRFTRYVAGLDVESDKAGGDPSPWTALGVFLSIQSALQGNMRGQRVAVQGVGAVGIKLCALLNEAGAALYVADASDARAALARDAFDAKIVSVSDIHRADVDVYAPCALGGILHSETILDLRASVVCGAANNQLREDCAGELLRQLGILYCPDYVVNAGGIISATAERSGESKDVVEDRVGMIVNRLQAIISEAAMKRVATNLIADEHARQILDL